MSVLGGEFAIMLLAAGKWNELAKLEDVLTTAGDKLDLIKEVVTASDPANAELELYLDEAGDKKITCTALVTNAEYGATVGELQVVSVNFTANGTITLSI